MKKGRGLSLYVSIGAWAHSQFKINALGVRIVVGWVAINLCFYDVDWVLGTLVTKYDEMKNKEVTCEV